MSENSASSSVSSPLSGTSSSSASQQSGQTSTRDKGVLITKSNTTAKEWEYFKVYQYDKETANCSLCKANIRWSRSTSTLTRHLQAKHTKEYAELIKVQVEGRKQETQTGMEAFVNGGHRSDQEEKLLKWVVQTYQPYSAVEHDSFRQFVQSHNRKASSVSRKHIKTLVKEKVAIVKTCVDAMVRLERGAVTTDGWTSKANQSYFAFTFHWIDEEFELHSIPLGIVHHKGTSTAEDHFSALEVEGVRHGLTWQNIVAIVTDTEPTMNATGRLIAERTAGLNLVVEHVGCADHILNTTTKKCALDPDYAPHPLPAEAGALKIARGLVGSFSGSSQMEERLLALQANGHTRPVGLIQDVTTRWWSTFSMIERLLRVKNYVNILAQQFRTLVNLNPAQWNLLEEIEHVLKPFMYAQKLLEGEKYVTISFIPTIISKIRSDLEATQRRPDNTEYVTAMLNKLRNSFDAEWGLGVPNTMYDEHLSVGERNRHKGYRPLHMVAAYLDPRTKLLHVFGEEDKAKIVQETKRRALVIRAELVADMQLANNQAAEAAPVGNVGFAGVAGVYDPLFDHLDAEVLPVAHHEAVAAFNFDVEREMQAFAAAPKLHRVRGVVVDAHGNERQVFNNPLEWWKLHRREFPVLSLLARRTLCVPATSAPSERLFSTAGLTIANDRTRLLPESASDLIFLHDAWPLMEEHVAGKRRRLDENLERKK